MPRSGRSRTSCRDIRAYGPARTRESDRRNETLRRRVLPRFAKLSDYERLQWVDELRLFTVMARTAETAERQERLRRDETIIPDNG